MKPFLAENAFHKLSSRTFFRPHPEIAQFIFIVRSIWGSGDFYLAYNSIPVFTPHEQLYYSPPGERLGGKGGIWWESTTHDLADSGIADAVKHLATEAFSFFDRTSTTADLLDELNDCVFGPSQPLDFQKAVCLARLSRIDESLKMIEIVTATNWDVYSAPDSDPITLRTALMAGTHHELLQTWRSEFITHNKLQQWYP